MLRVYFGSLFSLPMYCFSYRAFHVTNTHFCHFYEWIDTSISPRDQQYVAWLKKVDEDVRKSGIDKAKRGNSTGRE